MNESSASNCPLRDNTDRRKSAPIAIANTQPDAGAHWVKSAALAKKILGSKASRQAGASADFVEFKNPDSAPVFFLEGAEHFKKRRMTQRFLSPKAIADQHFVIMNKVTQDLLRQFIARGSARLEELSFSLAIEVVGEILGLTNSDQAARARRIQRVLAASVAAAGNSAFSRARLNLARAWHIGIFFLADVRPAIKARKAAPRADAISVYLEEGYSHIAIVIECLTYGTAGMLTTREFIVMAAWYLFEQEALRKRFLEGDVNDQMAILMEILRLEPVAAMLHRRMDEAMEGVADRPLPPGEKYGIDIRAANVDEGLAGECPFALDPDRAKRQKDLGRYLSFGDGPHTCPGWQVALHETRIFLQQLFRVPGITLAREPDISWNAQLGSYELRHADITCDTPA
jgi:cytochrome P450